MRVSIEELLTRGIANIIPSKEELKKVFEAGKKLNVYLGIDPTSTRIHLGHAVPLRKLQAFAELGHNVTFVIGDFTALIGDTSDKDSERPALTTEEIRANFKTYKKQAEKLVDFSKVKVRYNSEWLNKLSFFDIIKLCQHFSFGDFASRELIKKRLESGSRVGLHEALYPVMQGYDSYFMDTDIQLGGTDQTFNMQAGRTLQKNLRNKESFVMANSFLTGTDGRKMSKSWGNAIWLEDDANDMYGKIMSITDNLIYEYFVLATDVPTNDVREIEKALRKSNNPMLYKKRLAFEIVKQLNNVDKAKKAQEFFEQTVQKGQLPQDIPIIEVPKTLSQGSTIADALRGLELVNSKSEAKRLVVQGGVVVDNETIIDPQAPFMPVDGTLIQVGKRKFIRLKTSI